MFPIVGHIRLPLAYPRPEPLRSGLRCHRVAVLIVALCCTASLVRAQTPGYPTATIYSQTDYAKDFCIIKKGGLWHAFYIHGGLLGENDFEHQTSRNLWNWTSRANVLTPPRSPAEWQQSNVWAPHIVESGGVYYMFYTGVSDTTIAPFGTVEQQHIGLARSSDANLDTWTQIPSLPSGVVSYILGPESPGESWVHSSPEQRAHFRDAFVMKDPTDASRWLMYFAAIPQNMPGGGANNGAMELGLATTQDTPGLQFGWTGLDDLGSTHRVFSTTEFAPDNVSGKVESPHVLRHGSDYYLFISGDTNANGPPPPASTWRGGILVLKNSSPLTDAWVFQGTIRSITGIDWAAAWFASETFSEQYSPTLSEDFFCHIDGTSAIEIRQIVWGPSGIQKLIQPLRATPLALDASQVFEHSAVTLTINNQWAGAPDNETRVAPLDVEEIDDDGTNEALSPWQVGLPATLAVTGSQRNYTWNVSRWPDDDSTPDVMEIRIGVRGQQTPILEVLQTPPEHDPYHEGANARRVRPEGQPGGTTGETAETLTLTVLGDTSHGPGIGLLVDAPVATQARLDLYDLQGRRIRNLIDRVVQRGQTIELWNGRDSNGEGVRPGVYLARLVTPRMSRTVKVLLQP